MLCSSSFVAVGNVQKKKGEAQQEVNKPST